MNNELLILVVVIIFTAITLIFLYRIGKKEAKKAKDKDPAESIRFDINFDECKPGDIVWLKSGMLPMTIREKCDDKKISCIWMDKKGQINTCRFNPEELRRNTSK